MFMRAPHHSLRVSAEQRRCPSLWRSGVCAKLLLVSSVLVSNACATVQQPDFSVSSTTGSVLNVQSLGEFNQPWAMSFLPTGELLVSEKPGQLWLLSVKANAASVDAPHPSFATVSADSLVRVPVSGLPQIQARGQGGFGDVILHPDYASNSQIYISYVEREGDVSGAAVIKGRLDLGDPSAPALVDQSVIWRQTPKVTGEGHYGHKLAFSTDGYLFITSGERQKFDPAQDMQMNLGKVIRLLDDGRVPDDNPWAGQGGVAGEFWSIGHRNPLGIAFSDKGDLWVHEMGPRGGDELNRVMEGENYGYPLVSDGNHYSGAPIPDHDTRADLQAPLISWSPVISPSSLVIYDGEQYPQWRGTGLIGGLSSQALVRVSLDGPVREIERFAMGKRIREVEQDAFGVVYLLEDRAGGRLLRLSMP